MAYRRRYLSGQAATTVVIAEGAITSDKIVDKAVTQPKVADDAITSDKIADETIESEDIKAGEVKTSDLGDGAVTTNKIADQAVTVAKLESAIQGIARPLVPGVATAEIADLSVTEGKLAASAVASTKIKAGAVNAAALAGNAVETAKIKDANVTLAKLAPGSVDNTKIIADAVRSTEILAGACGESELGTDSVVTSKVKDANITLPKMASNSVDTDQLIADAVTHPRLDVAALARRHIESKDARILTHLEEFGGIDVSNKWAKKGDAGGLVYMDGEHGLRIQTTNVTQKQQWMDWDENWIGYPGVAKPLVNIEISKRANPVTYFLNYCGIWDSDLDCIVFYAFDNAGGTPNWEALCRKDGAETKVDTLVAVTNGTQLLSIDVLSAASVKFYIDGIEKAHIETNIPDDEQMEPIIYIQAKSNAIRDFYVKYFSILGNRPTYA